MGHEERHKNREKCYKIISNTKGWLEFSGIESIQSVLTLANEFGDIIAHPDGNEFNIITPRKKNNSYPGTLSHLHEYGEFPLHTDTAFWSVPARYIVLAMLIENNNSTLVVSADKIFNSLDAEVKKIAREAVFKVETPFGEFDTRAIFEKSGEIGIRFNACCMTPSNSSAEIFFEEFDRALKHIRPNQIQWTGNKAIVIDNWKVVHGRPAIIDPIDNERSLIRVYVS